MSRRRPVGPALLLLALAGAACRPASPPVAELAAAPERIELAWPSFAELEISLRPLAELPEGARPIVFVHLLDEPGSVLRTYDHEPVGAWRTGAELRYRIRLHQSALAEPLAAGDYLLSLGLYHPEHGRFALATEAEPIARHEYRVAEVVVPAPAADAPRLRFSEEWLPPTASVDRQVLSRRQLRGDAVGRIGFGPVAEAGTLALGLVVPSTPKAGARLELLDGSGQPKVRIAADCGGSEVEVSGTGRFDVDLALPAPATAGDSPRECEITLAPNFRLTLSDRAETTSVVLESISWRAEPGAAREGEPAAPTAPAAR